MRYILLAACLFTFQTTFCQTKPGNKQLADLFTAYTDETHILFPLAATATGNYRYNHLMPVTFTNSYNQKSKQLYTKYLGAIKKFNRASLNNDDKISYDIFKRNMEMALEGLTYKTNRMPLHQMSGFHLQWPQLGSGTGAQPFKTVKDYDDWAARVRMFPAWADSMITYFKKGLNENMIMPRSLVVKIIPQMQALVQDDVTKSVFYGPVNKFPSGFSEAEKARLTDDYKKLITEYLNPSYKKMADFMKDEYLPKSRATSGIGALPGGKKMYDYAIRAYTTTNKKPEELFNTGLAEVKRIRSEMEKVKAMVQFNGTLDSFFVYAKTDPKFLPYKNAEEVLVAYRAIQSKIEPHLDALFTIKPKTPFEIRQTEAFRAASAAAQYNAGLPDGSRPGIFYVPIVDATKYTTAKENLFIHEAIPGHHFQVMIQKENTSLPKFRQDGGNSAYAEGWGLYSESLGRMLGCYTDPYQYFYALGDEMHRAIRLVTDAGIHAKGWTREQAITYMRSNEPITEQSATSEIERYMAMPGQALSYKVGELKIKELRNKYQKMLGKKFKLSAFHDELLRDGNMPLVTLEKKMDAWAAGLK